MLARASTGRWLLASLGLLLVTGCARSPEQKQGTEQPGPVLSGESVDSPDPKRLTAASAAECEAFGDHMVALMMGELDERLHEQMRPQAEAQRPDLVEGCLRDGSSEEVACVLEVDDLSQVELCRAGAAQLLPPERSPGAGGPARSEVDRATCEEFARHMGALTRRQIMEDAGAAESNPEVLGKAEAAAKQVEEDLLPICLEQGTLPEVQCALAARSLAEVDRCGP